MVEARCRMRELALRTRPPDPRALADAATRGDDQALYALVRAAPLEARTTTETIRLHEWARAASAGNTRDADAHLRVARAVGDALKRFSREALLCDAVTVIARASPSQRAKLADAHTRYFEARLLYNNRKIGASEKLFREAAVGFAAARSPMELLAWYYVASCLYDRGRTSEALRTLDEISSHAPESHRALHAQILWLRSTIASRDGRLNEALASSQASAALFTALGERRFATIMRGAQAGLHSLLGHRAESWRIRHANFRDLADANEALQQAVNVAARTEALAGHWDSAHSLLTVALEPELRVNARVLASTLIWHALSADTIGATAPIRRDLDEAKGVLASISDSSLRANAFAELTFAGGVLRRGDAMQSVEILTRFIDQARAQRDPFLLAEAFLARARAHRTLGRSEDAIADLRQALSWVEARHTDDRESFGEAYFATSRNARRELVDVLDRAGRTDEAFALFQKRGSGDRPVSEDLLVLVAISLPDRVLLLTRTARAVESTRVSVDERTVRQAIDRLSRCIDGNANDCVAASAATLGAWLLAPIRAKVAAARTLVVIPDDIIGAVPFALLQERPESGSIVERLPSAVASAAVTAPVDDRITEHDTIVAVGDPSFSRATFPALESLPAAAGEAERVAALYGNTRALLAEAATKAEVLRRMRAANVVHIATHATVAPADPQRSCLLLAAAERDSGALYVHEIERMRLPSLRLVVLSGCRTAVPSTTAGAGESIALAFLQSGARAVVGTLWDIDDDVASYIGVALHREILTGAPVPEALRRVQISMMRSADPRIRSARAWASLRVYVR